MFLYKGVIWWWYTGSGYRRIACELHERVQTWVDDNNQVFMNTLAFHIGQLYLTLFRFTFKMSRTQWSLTSNPPQELGSAWVDVKTSLVYGKSISRLIHGCISLCEIVVCIPCAALWTYHSDFVCGFSHKVLGSLKRAREVTALHQKPGFLSLCCPLLFLSLRQNESHKDWWWWLWWWWRCDDWENSDSGDKTPRGHLMVTTKILLY